MKAMILEAYGPDAGFRLAEVPTPSAAPGQVLVQVAATSVNTVDTMIRQLGQAELPISPDLPAVLGMDFTGTVTAVGDGVTRFRPGDEVYGCAGGLVGLPGALAEYISADASLLARKPANLSMREAAALPLVGITAWEGLQRSGVAPGQKVLVHGGAGGVGHVAVQLARHLGAEVSATGTGDRQMSLIAHLGAAAIDYREEQVADYVARCTDGTGFDVVFDTVGGANMANSFSAAALNGHVASTVAMVELDLTEAHFRGLSLHVIFMLIPMLHNHRRDAHGVILARLAEAVESGAVKPILDDRRFGLGEVEAAHARLTGGEAVGKVVVEVRS